MSAWMEQVVRGSRLGSHIAASRLDLEDLLVANDFESDDDLDFSLA